MEVSLAFSCLNYGEFVFFRTITILMDGQTEYLLQVHGGVLEVLSECSS